MFTVFSKYRLTLNVSVPCTSVNGAAVKQAIDLLGAGGRRSATQMCFPQIKARNSPVFFKNNELH